MTEPTLEPAAPPLGIFARMIGIIVSPRSTFQNVVAAPRPVGMLFLVAAIIGIASVAPQMTESGRQAGLDAQVKFMERIGTTVTPEMYERMETQSRSIPLRLVGVLGSFIVLPIIALFFAAIYWAVFNTALGGTASFKQVLAVQTHAQVIGALGMVAALPITLTRGMTNMTGPFNLGALVPGLPEGSMLTTFLSGLSVFSIWQIAVVGIGLAVLYRRNSRNIIIALLACYLVIVYIASSLFSSFMGRAGS